MVVIFFITKYWTEITLFLWQKASGGLLWPKPQSNQKAFLSPELRLSFVPVKNPKLASLKQGILFPRCKRRSSNGDEIQYKFQNKKALQH